MAIRTKGKKKIFVLDTSVIIYSHDAIMNFAEHDVAIPITVLEELDHFKKGNDIKNFEAREFIRIIEKISKGQKLQHWIPINGKSRGRFKVLMNLQSELDAEKIFDEKKPDHKILNAALQLQSENSQDRVILVSKDINLRLKAKSLNLQAEDYKTGKIKNVNTLYTGKSVIENTNGEIINELYEQKSCDVKALLKRKKPVAHNYFIIKSERKSGLAYYNPE